MTNKFLEVFNGNFADVPPFWFMRQAGRYMAEYRDLRAKAGSFLNLCYNPDYATEVTLQPIRHFDMDAAILFADILLVPMALGIPLEFANGEGPKLGAYDINKLEYDESIVNPVFETVKKLSRHELLKDKALIGFSGSPWTVATYIVEGGSSKHFTEVKKMALNEPDKFQQLIDILVDSTTTYLISQIKAGAQVLQVFDSWAGELAEDEFEKWVIKPTAKIVKNIKTQYPDIKIIGFPRRANMLLKRFVAETGVDAVSLDSTVPLQWAFENLPCVIQGNLDNVTLLASKETIKREAEKILQSARGKPFIFNLGHGIMQQTPVENIEYLCEVIRNYK